MPEKIIRFNDYEINKDGVVTKGSLPIEKTTDRFGNDQVLLIDNNGRNAKISIARLLYEQWLAEFEIFDSAQIRFRDMDNKNLSLDNLTAISYRELMQSQGSKYRGVNRNTHRNCYRVIMRNVANKRKELFHSHDERECALFYDEELTKRMLAKGIPEENILTNKRLGLL